MKRVRVGFVVDSDGVAQEFLWPPLWIIPELIDPPRFEARLDRLWLIP